MEESWKFPEQKGRPVRVEVCSDTGEVELWLNGTLIGRRAVEDCRPNFKRRTTPASSVQ